MLYFMYCFDIELLISLLLSFRVSDCLGRRLGPRLLGRVDDSGVIDFFTQML